MSTWENVRTVLLASGGIILLLLIATAWLRRMISVNKVRKMPMGKKLEKIDDLAEPFGFFYVKGWDVFSTRMNAWQRKMGYEALFDAAAPSVHMVMDVLPVYFDHDGRTWLIEFWKGQYGINSGGEVGVYHADRIVPPEEYKFAHFDAAADDELPWICYKLTREGRTLYASEMRHWWLTGFDMGCFSEPGQLVLQVEFAFDDQGLADAFCEGLSKSPVADSYGHCGNEVYVRMDHSPKEALLARIQRAWAQCWNRFWVRVFLLATRPFKSSLDRLLFLYELLPWCVKRLMGLASRYVRIDEKAGRKRRKRKCCV